MWILSLKGYVSCLLLPFQSREMPFLLVKICEVISSSVASSWPATDALIPRIISPWRLQLPIFLPLALPPATLECLIMSMIKYWKLFFFFFFCLVPPICAYLKHREMSKLSSWQFWHITKKKKRKRRKEKNIFFPPPCRDNAFLQDVWNSVF